MKLKKKHLFSTNSFLTLRRISISISQLEKRWVEKCWLLGLTCKYKLFH